jgi:hypothetical protein
LLHPRAALSVVLDAALFVAERLRFMVLTLASIIAAKLAVALLLPLI